MVNVVVALTLVILASLFGLFLVRRLVPPSRLAQHTDVAGYVYAVIGVLYAVMLAQMVITSWEEYRDARESATTEATAILNLSRLAAAWPGESRSTVETALERYARNVIEVEWIELSRDEFAAERHTAPMHELWSAFNTAGHAPGASQSVYAAALDQLDLLVAARRDRVTLAEDGLPTTMMFTLILGAIVTVGFSYLFAVDNLWAHGLMTSSLAVLIALLLLLASELETPFSGTSAIAPTAMEFALNEILFNLGGETAP